MPVEIKELIIRAVVDRNAQLAASEVESDPHSTNDDVQLPALRTNHIVQECVRQVMQLLNRERSR